MQVSGRKRYRKQSSSGKNMNSRLKTEGIMEVHSIAGEYDLAVIARVGDNQELSLILADKMCHQMKGITHTKTLISLGAHYNFDEKKVFKKSKNK